MQCMMPGRSVWRLSLRVAYWEDTTCSAAPACKQLLPIGYLPVQALFAVQACLPGCSVNCTFDVLAHRARITERHIIPPLGSPWLMAVEKGIGGSSGVCCGEGGVEGGSRGRCAWRCSCALQSQWLKYQAAVPAAVASLQQVGFQNRAPVLAKILPHHSRRSIQTVPRDIFKVL